ncbi:MAG: response regulator [Spirochaetales bacterium]|nr:response regulator [Spirochaetales bacterium]
MLKLITVDDERYFHKGLDKLINWTECSIERIGEAYNGESALETIYAKKPDIIMTDIRMPGMDGLELLRQVSEIEDYRPDWIIISGYDDFSFARNAMRYGVKYYLLKPVDESELRKILEQITESRKQEKILGTLNIVEKRLAISALIRRLISGPDNKKTVEKARQIITVEGPLRFIQIVSNIDLSSDVEFLLRSELKRIKAMYASEYITVHGRHLLGFILPENDLVNMNLQKFCHKLYKSCAAQIDNPIYLVAGPAVSGIENLYESYTGAQAMLGMILDEPGKPILIADSFLYDGNRQGEDAIKEIVFFPELICSIEQGEKEEISRYIEKILSWVYGKKLNIQSVRIWLNCLFVDISRLILELDGKLDVRIREFFQMSISDTLIIKRELFQNVCDFCIYCAERILELKRLNKSGILMLVMDYIRTNYFRELSLRDLGDRFGINPVYLGQMFKHTLSKSYKQFLLETRIDEAKKLLSRTDLKVYEVAKSVGYNDSDYFSEQFLKITGKRPAAYKK